MSIYDYQGNGIPTVFASVKDYGAKGDGTTDDKTAIQSVLTALKDTGGIIFFPKGTYLIKSSVLFYSNQSLIFEDGATLLQGAAVNNLLRTYCQSSYTGHSGVHDCLVYGAVFDGGAYTENNTLVGIAHCKNITFERCTFKNAYGTWHNLEINSAYNVKVKNCEFEGVRKTGNYGELIQIDAPSSSSGYPWSGTAIDSTPCKYIDIEGCIFHDDTVAPAIGNHNPQAHQFIKIHDCIFDGIVSDRGVIVLTSHNDVNPTDIDIYDNIFNGCGTCVASSGETYYIRGNRFVDCTTAIAGTASIAHGNIINGTYTA